MYYFKTSSAYENTIITKINAPQETWQKTFFLISPNDTMLILKLTTRKIFKEKLNYSYVRGMFPQSNNQIKLKVGIRV